MLLSYIIWNGNPIIFSTDRFSMRWYGVLFSMGFLLAPFIGRYIFEKENKPVKELDRIILYIMISTMVGARLGHVLFYEPYLFLSNPLRVFLPIKFNPFKIIGFQGLSSHGATIGIVIALYLCINHRFDFNLYPFRFRFIKNVNKPSSFLWITTPAVIIIALAGGFIRVGNFMNSEIWGKPTNSNFGVLFARNITNELYESFPFIKDVSFSKVKPVNGEPLDKAINCIITTKRLNVNNDQVDNFTKGALRSLFYSSESVNQHIKVDFDAYPCSVSSNKGEYTITVKGVAIARHPSQLYEAFSCFILFFILLLIWKNSIGKLGDGEISGIFLMYVFGLRFFYEFFKETSYFAPNMSLNIAHILSIPMFLLGLTFFISGYKNRKRTNGN